MAEDDHTESDSQLEVQQARLEMRRHIEEQWVRRSKRWEQPATATEKADLAEDVQVPKAVSPNRDSSDKAVQMLW